MITLRRDHDDIVTTLQVEEGVMAIHGLQTYLASPILHTSHKAEMLALCLQLLTLLLKVAIQRLYLPPEIL